ERQSGQALVAPKIKPHANLPYRDAPQAWPRVAGSNHYYAPALQALIITGCRTNEIRGLKWDYIQSGLISIPASVMKMSRPHRIPIVPPLQSIIDDMAALRRNEYVFPGQEADTMNENALTLLTKAMFPDATGHGWRSTFRTWAQEHLSADFYDP